MKRLIALASLYAFLSGGLLFALDNTNNGNTAANANTGASNTATTESKTSTTTTTSNNNAGTTANTEANAAKPAYGTGTDLAGTNLPAVRDFKGFRTVADNKLHQWRDLISDMKDGGKKHPFKPGVSKQEINQTISFLEQREKAVRHDVKKVHSDDAWHKAEAGVEKNLTDMRHAYAKVVQDVAE